MNSPKRQQQSPKEIAILVAGHIYNLCPRFVPAQILCKKLAGRSHKCRLENLESPKEVIEKVQKSGGLVFIHVSEMRDVSILSELIKSLTLDLERGFISLIVVSRVQVIFIKKLLSNCPLSLVLSSTVSTSELEKAVSELFRRTEFKENNLLGKALKPAGPQSVLRYSKNLGNGTFVMKGTPNSSRVMIEERKLATPSLELSSSHGPSVPTNAVQGPARSEGKKPLGQSGLFEPIDSDEKRHQLLHECVDSRARVIMSHSDCSMKIEGLFIQLNAQANQMKFLVKSEGQVLKDFLSSQGPSRKVIFAAGLPRSRLFFSTSQFKLNEGGVSTLEIPIPKDLYAVQRRGQFRFVLFPDVSELASFQCGDDPHSLRMPLYDLSAGGLALLCTEAEVEKIQQCSVFQNIRFFIEDQEIRVSEMRRCHITPFSVDRKTMLYRVGCEFTGLKAPSRKIIDGFVDRKSQRYFETYFG